MKVQQNHSPSFCQQIKNNQTKIITYLAAFALVTLWVSFLQNNRKIAKPLVVGQLTGFILGVGTALTKEKQINDTSKGKDLKYVDYSNQSLGLKINNTIKNNLDPLTTAVALSVFSTLVLQSIVKLPFLVGSLSAFLLGEYLYLDCITQPRGKSDSEKRTNSQATTS